MPPPQLPGTGVFTIEGYTAEASSSAVSSETQPYQQANFSLPGTSAASRNLHTRRRTTSAPWNQGLVNFNVQGAERRRAVSNTPRMEPYPSPRLRGQGQAREECRIAGGADVQNSIQRSSLQYSPPLTPSSPLLSIRSEGSFSEPSLTNSSLLFSEQCFESHQSSQWSEPHWQHQFSPPSLSPLSISTSLGPAQFPNHDWHDDLAGAQNYAPQTEASCLPPLSQLPHSTYPTSPPRLSRAFTGAHANPEPDTIPWSQRTNKSKVSVALDVLRTLQDHKLNVVKLLEYVISPLEEFASYQNTLFASNKHDTLKFLFEAIITHEKGGPIMKKWMTPHALELVCEEIHSEMEAAKPYLRMYPRNVSPEFIESWDISKIMDYVSSKVTRTWTTVLDAATESKATRLRPTPQSGKKRNRVIGRHIISSQVHYLRSQASAIVQMGLGLMGWSTGTSKAMLNVLHRSCLTIPYSTLTDAIDVLANGAIARARVAASIPHGLAYDNINLSSSIFVEQGPNMMSKVQSGTFAIIYELVGANADHMQVKEMLESFKKATPLQIEDLRPSRKSVASYLNQTAVTVAQTLFRYVKGFEHHVPHPLFQHTKRRPLLEGRKTIFYPLRTTTIEEASIEGNLLVHDDVYMVQLNKDYETLKKVAIPVYADQLTLARIRGAQTLRQNDIDSWERREIFQLAFGLFHLVMNLIWSLLEIHRGTINQVGSLTHLFALLEKARLGGEHPDYHTLQAALMQILDGLILNAWRIESGKATLTEFAASESTPEAILALANKIVNNYTVPSQPINATNSKAPPRDFDGTKPTTSDSAQDTVYNNIMLLTRDLLYVSELVNAIEMGDFGRVEDVLPTVACMFRGAGSNNYSTEILHLLFNIKKVWTPEFANIMRDNMLVNISGLPGHFMGIDLNIEHLIRYLKALFTAKGIYSNWDRLGNISASVNHLQLIKKQVIKSFKTEYQGSSHSKVDTTALVWRVAEKARELNLQTFVVDRDLNKSAKPLTDVQFVGFKKFQTASLESFNKKIEEFRKGGDMTAEIDDMAPCSIDYLNHDELDNDGDETSALHDSNND